MAQRKVRSVNKSLTEEERVRHRTIREQVEQEKTDLIARGRRAKARRTMLREAVMGCDRAIPKLQSGSCHLGS